MNVLNTYQLLFETECVSLWANFNNWFVLDLNVLGLVGLDIFAWNKSLYV